MNLLFRADATVQIGTGHVMRCLALAQAVQDSGGQAVFATAEMPPAIQARLAAEAFKVQIIASNGGEKDAVETIALGRQTHSDWIVVDGYKFGAEYQRALKDAGFKVLFVDDYGHATHYFADLVLNQNAYARTSMYRGREAYTRLLLGTRYCLLRREFVAWGGWNREIASVGSKVLITLGGSDPENVTGKVVAALGRLPEIEATVVAGGGNPHLETLQRLVTECGHAIRLMNSVSDMPELMAWADMAVAGAGSTCWEFCLLKLPMAVTDIADNQTPIAHSLRERGAAHYLGSAGALEADGIAQQVAHLLAAKDERASLSDCCGKLVDGLGAARVLDELGRG